MGDPSPATGLTGLSLASRPPLGLESRLDEAVVLPVPGSWDPGLCVDHEELVLSVEASTSTTVGLKQVFSPAHTGIPGDLLRAVIPQTTHGVGFLQTSNHAQRYQQIRSWLVSGGFRVRASSFLLLPSLRKSVLHS